MSKGLWTRTLMGATAVLAGAAMAHAIPVQLNTAKDGYTGSMTDAWTEVSIKADTTTYQYDTDGSGTLSVGDRFTDWGNARWTDYTFVPGGADDQGLNTYTSGFKGYEVTIVWNDVTGKVTQAPTVQPNGNLVSQTKYDGGSFDFYFDNLNTGGVPNKSSFGSTAWSTDDTGFLEGIHFMTIDLTSGSGTNTFNPSGAFIHGSSQIYGTVSMLLADYLYSYPSLVDLSNFIALEWLVGDVDQNTEEKTIVFTPGMLDPDGRVTLFSIGSRHDGGLRLDVVPEPGTMLLLGSGLLGLAGVGRRRSKKA